MKCLIYCTQGKPYLYKSYEDNGGLAENGTLRDWVEYGISNSLINECNCHKLNGKVVASFECDKVEEIDDCFTMEHIDNEYPDTYELGDMQEEQLLKECYLTKEEMNAYYKGVKEPLKAIHITNLEIFDKPKELGDGEFEIHRIVKCKNCVNYNSCKQMNSKCANGYCNIENGYCDVYYPLTKAPMNMCYCIYNGELCVIISIQPQWVEKILNGTKTIEVRKQILNKLKELVHIAIR